MDSLTLEGEGEGGPRKEAYPKNGHGLKDEAEKRRGLSLCFGKRTTRRLDRCPSNRGRTKGNSGARSKVAGCGSKVKKTTTMQGKENGSKKRGVTVAALLVEKTSGGEKGGKNRCLKKKTYY